MAREANFLDRQAADRPWRRRDLLKACIPFLTAGTGMTALSAPGRGGTADGAADVDVAVIGAGAAGIAACRAVLSSGFSALMIEARDRIGGRALTIQPLPKLPLDLGCGYLHSAEKNPWTDIAERLGFALSRSAPGEGDSAPGMIGIDTAERAEWQAVRDAFQRRIDREAARGPDRPASALLPPNGRWNTLLDALSTWEDGAALGCVSLLDSARYDDSGGDWRVPGGYGAVIAAYGAALPVRLGVTVRRVDHRGRVVRIATSAGTLEARRAIITVPTAAIAGGAIAFVPDLAEKRAAADGLPLGFATKLFLAVEESDERAFPADTALVGTTERIATGSYVLRPHGRPVVECFFGGCLALELENAGIEATTEFARQEIASFFGDTAVRRLRPLAGSAWASDSLAGGAYSYARPGHADDRERLAAPIDGRLFFAGEACSADAYGTAHGAFASGLSAAAQAVASLRMI